MGSHKAKTAAERIAASCGAIVLMVRVDFTEPLAAGVGDAGFREQVGADSGVGCTEHVRFTALLNAFTEVSVTLEVALVPAATAAGAGVEADIVKSGAVEVKVAVIV